MSQASGDKYLTVAFLQTASAGSCTAYWNGDTSQPISSSTFGSDIATIQADGGNVIPSFGGYTADTTGTDIADSCTNVSSIAAVYENVITTYNVSRIDLDIEANSLTEHRRHHPAQRGGGAGRGLGRGQRPHASSSPTRCRATTTGLASDRPGRAAERDDRRRHRQRRQHHDVRLLHRHHAGDGDRHRVGRRRASTASSQSLYPSETSAQLWGMIGITEMPGIDDYGADETFTEADATTVLNWAESKGISTLSFWALERDNGGCVGTGGSDTCSGHLADAPGTSATPSSRSPAAATTPPPTNGFSVAVSPASGSVAAGCSATATVSTAVTSGSAQ